LKKCDLELYQVVHDATEEPVDAVRALIEKGATSDFIDTDGNAVIHIIAKKGFVQLLGVLLATFPAEINRKSKSGDSPLSLALENSHQNCWKLLISNRAENQIYAFLTSAQNAKNLADFLDDVSETGDLNQLIKSDLNLMKSKKLKIDQHRISKLQKYIFGEFLGENLDEIMGEYEKLKDENHSILADNRALITENESLGQFEGQLKSEVETLSLSIQKLTEDSTELINSNQQLTIDNNEIKV